MKDILRGFIGGLVSVLFMFLFLGSWSEWSSVVHRLARNSVIGDGGGSAVVKDSMYVEKTFGVGTATMQNSALVAEVNAGSVNQGGVLVRGSGANVRVVISNESAPAGQKSFSLTHNGPNSVFLLQATNDSYGWVRNVLALTHTGNVGIGTISPDETFEVEWVSGGTDVEIGRGATDPDVTFITLRSPNGTKYYLYPDDLGNLVITTTKP